MRIAEMRDATNHALTVAAAVKAGIFRQLAEEAATPAQLAARCSLDPRAVDVVLPLLAELGLVQVVDGIYRLTDEGREQLVDGRDPKYVADAFPLWEDNVRRWIQLASVLRNGAPVQPLGAEPVAEGSDEFAGAMVSGSARRVSHLVELCLRRAPHARSALDLGAGPAHYALALARAGLAVTAFDRPDVVARATEVTAGKRPPELRFASGDFLVDPLPPGPFDLVLLMNVCHLHSPELNRLLVRRAYGVLSPGGVLAIGDFLLGRSPRAPMKGVLMLLRFEGGRTYREAEYRSWMEEVGLRNVVVDDVLDPNRQLVTAIRSADA